MQSNVLHYLLDRRSDGTEEVMVYDDRDLAAYFTAAKRRALSQGHAVKHEWPDGTHSHFVDMVTAAREKGCN